MALSFEELRQLFIDKLLTAIKIPAEELNNLVDELLTTCEFQLDDLTETFKGSATTSTNPGTPTGRAWYLTSGTGTYTNFDNLVVSELFGILIYNGSAWELIEHEITVDMSDYVKNIMESDLDADGNRIINLPDLVNETDALSGESADSKYIELGKNLFNKDTVTTGYYVNASTGNLSGNASYQATDYIAVVAGESYTRTLGVYHAWYDSSKVFISGSSSSDATIVAPTGAYFVRYSIIISTYDENTHQFEHGASATSFEAFIKRFKQSRLVVSNTEFSGELTEEKIDSDFRARLEEIGKNKFNKNTINSGYYINTTTGALSGGGTNVNYDATDYIPVIAGENYYRTDGYHYAWYDVSKAFISGFVNYEKTLIAPTGAAYIRYTLNKTIYDEDTHQFEKGTEPTPFEVYRIIKKLEDDQVNIEKVDGSIKGMFATRIIMPDVIYGVVGETLQVFYKSIIEAIDVDSMCVQIEASVSGIIQYKRYFEFRPTVAADSDVVIKVYNNFGYLMARKEFTIKVKVEGSLPGSTLYIHTIGDSLSNEGEWEKPLRDKIIADYGSANNLSWIGSQQHATDPNVKFEATAGYSWADYVGASSPYGSPLDITNYMSTYGPGVDGTGSNLLVFILLGWNGLKSGRLAQDHVLTIADAKTLVNHILATYSNATIVILSPNLGDQNLKGYDTNSKYSRFKTNQNIWGLGEAYRDWAENESNIEYIGTHQSFDSEHGCLSGSAFTSKAVNKWQTGITELVPDVSDWLHPTESRFIMDVAFNYLVYNYL